MQYWCKSDAASYFRLQSQLCGLSKLLPTTISDMLHVINNSLKELAIHFLK